MKRVKDMVAEANEKIRCIAGVEAKDLLVSWIRNTHGYRRA